MSYISGDILRGITERINYYENRWGMEVHSVYIEGDEVVIDYTQELPEIQANIERHSEPIYIEPPLRRGCHAKS